MAAGVADAFRLGLGSVSDYCVCVPPTNFSISANPPQASAVAIEESWRGNQKECQLTYGGRTPSMNRRHHLDIPVVVVRRDPSAISAGDSAAARLGGPPRPHDDHHRLRRSAIAAVGPPDYAEDAHSLAAAASAKTKQAGAGAVGGATGAATGGGGGSSDGEGVFVDAQAVFEPPHWPQAPKTSDS